MNCMKCGREIVLGQVFCKECLSNMEKYPVKPDTPVLLPNRTAAAAPRRASHSRKAQKPEERIARLRRLVFIQTLVLTAVLVALIVAIAIMTQRMDDMDNPVLPGQNYSTVETTWGS